MVDALRFCEVLLRQSGSYGHDGTWNGADTEVAIWNITITVEDLRGCLAFKEEWLQKIVTHFHDWNDKNWLPLLLNLKEWVETDLMQMWFVNETVEFIAHLLGVSPWTKHAIAVYGELQGHDHFPSQAWSLRECQGLLEQRINELTAMIVAEKADA